MLHVAETDLADDGEVPQGWESTAIEEEEEGLFLLVKVNLERMEGGEGVVRSRATKHVSSAALE
jgi:hypothetical protein